MIPATLYFEEKFVSDFSVIFNELYSIFERQKILKEGIGIDVQSSFNSLWKRQKCTCTCSVMKACASSLFGKRQKKS